MQISELPIPDLYQFIFQYSILELNTAIKPWVIEYLFSLSYDLVFYIDPDIYIYSPLTEIEMVLENKSDIALTPHILSPICDDKNPNELEIRKVGTYNLGFIALRNTPNTRTFLSWWQSKLLRDCVVDIPNGIFVDQSWIDLVPSIFENVTIIRHPGYNVAYWNIAQRSLVDNFDHVTANGDRLVFFHFSGFDYSNPRLFSKHQNRFTTDQLGSATQALILNYANSLRANGAETYSKLPYGFGVFKDGEKIPDFVRAFYRTDPRIRRESNKNPFQDSHLLLKSAVPGHPIMQHLTVALYSIWKARPDLQLAFPLTNTTSVKNFFTWFIGEGIAYFSARTVLMHEEMLAAFTDRDTDSYIAIDNIQKYSTALNRLYRATLNRQMDSCGHTTYVSSCATIRGRLQVFFNLIRSDESSILPLRTLRFLNGFVAAIRGAGVAARSYPNIPDKIIDESESIRPLSDAEANTSIYGIYEGDSDFTESGYWIGLQLVVKIPAHHSGRTLSITGLLFESYLRHDGDSRPILLIFSLNGTVFFTAPLDGSTTFSKKVGIPSFKSTTARLTIEASRSFVPKNIGLNADSRTLSWRIQYLAIDEYVVIDIKNAPYIFHNNLLPSLDGVSIVGYVRSEHGVGQFSRRLIRALRAANIDYSVFDVGEGLDTPQMISDVFEDAKDSSFPIDIFCVNADQAAFTVDRLIESGHETAHRVGFWHWEQTDLPIEMHQAYSYFDEIWVPSSFVNDSISKTSPIPVFKIPHAINVPPIGDGNYEIFGLPRDKFLVLVVYDFDSYQYRKNPIDAIRAYIAAAGNRTDCGLVIKTTNGHKHPDDQRILNSILKGLDSVYIFDSFFDEPTLEQLKRCCDCLISLHRSEGFGLNLAEMMALGKPVIATGWSGNMEFMSPMNSMLVNYRLTPLAEDLGPYRKGFDWATPDIDHASSLLRQLINNRNLREILGSQARMDITNHLNPYKIGQQAKKRLSLLLSRQLIKKKGEGK